MAFKVDVMKKQSIRKKDKNQVIWEEFVLKNSIKKKFQVLALVLMIKKSGYLPL